MALMYLDSIQSVVSEQRSSSTLVEKSAAFRRTGRLSTPPSTSGRAVDRVAEVVVVL